MPAYLTRLQCGAGRTQCMGQSAIGGRHVSLWQLLCRENYSGGSKPGLDHG